MYLYICYACGIPWTLAFIHSFNKQAFYPKVWFKLSGESKYLRLKSGGLSIRKLEISGCILQTKRWLNGLMTSTLYKALISKGSLPWGLMLCSHCPEVILSLNLCFVKQSSMGRCNRHCKPGASFPQSCPTPPSGDRAPVLLP